ncbi:hypothetical protein B0J17DRAFT_631882 [Rhizoctonia solani]|nr:hypothetical protein B0J17DRAFT_631882 [Rhizoctonia solani]
MANKGILVNILRTIVNAASQLEEIEIQQDIDSANCHLGLIGRGDKLDYSAKISGHKYVGADSEIQLAHNAVTVIENTRSIYIRSHYQIWDTPLRSRDLAFGWLADSTYDDPTDPNEMAQLFPSLKHLEGPAFFCNPIVNSDIARNLESLVVADITFNGELDWLAVMVGGIQEMPKLRRLVVVAHGFEEVINLLVLDILLSVAPALEVLECRLMVADFKHSQEDTASNCGRRQIMGGFSVRERMAAASGLRRLGEDYVESSEAVPLPRDLGVP